AARGRVAADRAVDRRRRRAAGEDVAAAAVDIATAAAGLTGARRGAVPTFPTAPAGPAGHRVRAQRDAAHSERAICVVHPGAVAAVSARASGPEGLERATVTGAAVAALAAGCAVADHDDAGERQCAAFVHYATAPHTAGGARGGDQRGRRGCGATVGARGAA